LSSFSLLYKAMVVGDWLQDIDSGGLAQLLVERQKPTATAVAG
jgi:hypothetical protein